MFSRFFIQRPIFSIVIAIVMVLVGILTFRSLPISQYPDITPPTVFVSAVYPGADAKTVANTVGEPIEEQVNGVEGMMYMSSNSSSDGTYSLTITFENGTDIDEATVKVQNRVSQVQATLPEPVIQQGVTVDSRASNILMFLSLDGDSAYNYDALYLTNYAQLHIIDALSRIDGVGNVGAFGGGEYSMRVWLDPLKMRARGLQPDDVKAAIEAQNVDVSAGTVGAQPGAGNAQFEFTLTSQGMLKSPSEFENIIIRSNNAEEGLLRLKDIGRVEMGSDDYTSVARVNGKQTALIAVSQRSGANALEVAKGVKAELEQLKQYFPPGVNYHILLDSTDYINASIDDLAMTFVETTLLVMLVILIFLQNWRAVIIPMLTIPVSLIATFAVMKLLGFSLNTLTLFGLVLSIAIVVDDAIVVVEDCQRIIDQGKMTVRQAALKAMRELQGAIVGEVLVLLSVFIPTAFISGITGELYKQFALTIAASTAFSGFNALTFTPAMCAMFLKPTNKNKKPFIVYRWFNKGYGATLSLYCRIVANFLKKPWVALLVFFAVVIPAFIIYVGLPTSYIPEEDMGYFMTNVELPVDASLDRTDKVSTQVTEAIKKIPGVKDVLMVAGHSFMGGNGSNMAGCFVTLEPWKDRKKKSLKINEILAEADKVTASIQEPIVFSLNPPAIPGLGVSGGLEMQLLDIDNLGAEAISEAIKTLQKAAPNYPDVGKLTTVYEGVVPQYRINIDRDKATLMGVGINDIYSALSSFVGGGFVNEFEDFGRMYHVNVAGEGASRRHPEDILKLGVRNNTGQMVPFESFATIDRDMGEASVNRYNMYETASITATPPHGTSSGDAIKAMEQMVKAELGTNFSYAWTGEAYQETGASTTISTVLIFAVILTLLVLAAQYGSWTDPIAVIISMPTAVLGVALGCIFMGQNVSIYTQIGLILLLGMSAKNAILIVEYAKEYREAGQDVRKAAYDAGRVRFRPIMMTAFAFIFGVMPMLFATGAGAGSRLALGTAVVFGMFVNAIIGTLFVPNFWELLQRFQEKYLAKYFKVKDTSKPSGGDITSDSSGDGDSSSESV